MEKATYLTASLNEVGGLLRIAQGDVRYITRYIIQYLQNNKNETKHKDNDDDVFVCSEDYCVSVSCDSYKVCDDNCMIIIDDNWLAIGYAIVEINHAYNILSSYDKKFILPLWYDGIDFMDYGRFKVKDGDKYNICNGRGEWLFDYGFYEIHEGNNCFLVKDVGCRYGIFGRDGKRKNNIWFSKKPCWKGSYFLVERDDLYNTMNTDGKLLCNTWFDRMSQEKTEGFREISSGKRVNFLNEEDGTILCDKWFKRIWKFHNGYAIVEIDDNEWSFVKKNGNFISSIRYNKIIFGFSEGFAAVEINGKHYFIDDERGDILQKKEGAEYDVIVGGFSNGQAFVMDKEGKKFLINLQGERVS